MLKRFSQLNKFNKENIIKSILNTKFQVRLIKYNLTTLSTTIENDIFKKISSLQLNIDIDNKKSSPQQHNIDEDFNDLLDEFEDNNIDEINSIQLEKYDKEYSLNRQNDLLDILTSFLSILNKNPTNKENLSEMIYNNLMLISKNIELMNINENSNIINDSIKEKISNLTNILEESYINIMKDYDIFGYLYYVFVLKNKSLIKVYGLRKNKLIHLSNIFYQLILQNKEHIPLKNLLEYLSILSYLRIIDNDIFEGRKYDLDYTFSFLELNKIVFRILRTKIIENKINILSFIIDLYIEKTLLEEYQFQITTIYLLSLLNNYILDVGIKNIYQIYRSIYNEIKSLFDEGDTFKVFLFYKDSFSYLIKSIHNFNSATSHFISIDNKDERLSTSSNTSTSSQGIKNKLSLLNDTFSSIMTIISNPSQDFLSNIENLTVINKKLNDSFYHISLMNESFQSILFNLYKQVEKIWECSFNIEINLCLVKFLRIHQVNNENIYMKIINSLLTISIEVKNKSLLSELTSLTSIILSYTSKDTDEDNNNMNKKKKNELIYKKVYCLYEEYLYQIKNKINHIYDYISQAGSQIHLLSYITNGYLIYNDLMNLLENPDFSEFRLWFYIRNEAEFKNKYSLFSLPEVERQLIQTTSIKDNYDYQIFLSKIYIMDYITKLPLNITKIIYNYIENKFINEEKGTKIGLKKRIRYFNYLLLINSYMKSNETFNRCIEKIDLHYKDDSFNIISQIKYFSLNHSSFINNDFLIFWISFLSKDIINSYEEEYQIYFLIKLGSSLLLNNSISIDIKSEIFNIIDSLYLKILLNEKMFRLSFKFMNLVELIMILYELNIKSICLSYVFLKKYSINMRFLQKNQVIYNNQIIRDKYKIDYNIHNEGLFNNDYSISDSISTNKDSLNDDLFEVAFKNGYEFEKKSSVHQEYFYINKMMNDNKEEIDRVYKYSIEIINENKDFSNKDNIKYVLEMIRNRSIYLKE